MKKEKEYDLTRREKAVLSLKGEEFSDEKNLQILVDQVKDIKFANISKKDGKTVIGNGLEYERFLFNKGKNTETIIDISDGKNINPIIKTDIVRNLRVICVGTVGEIDGLASMIKNG